MFRLGICVFYMGALRWDGRDARYCIENRFFLFARFCRFRRDEPENEVNLARSLFLKLKHAQDKSCGLAAVIQARMERGQSAEEDAMFHVKQFLFLPVLHVKQSCFSVRQAAARPVPPSRCHSERSEESSHWIYKP